MAVKYKIYIDKKLVYVKGKGEISFNDLLKHLVTLYDDPKYIAPMKKLVDYRNATLAKLTTQEANIITNKKAELKDKFVNERCAFVIKEDVDFGMSRVHGVYIEPSKIVAEVFRDINKALSWLEVDLDEEQLDLE